MSEELNEAALTTSLPGRYAKTLFELASSAQKLERIQQDLQDLCTAVHKSEDLALVFRSTEVTRQDQIKVVDALQKKFSFDPILGDFLKVLAMNRRLDCLLDILQLYTLLLENEKDIKPIEVISAHELLAKQKKDLQAVLKKSIKGELNLTYRLDPSLLGGIMVRMGSRIIDASLKARVQQLATVMKGNA